MAWRSRVLLPVLLMVVLMTCWSSQVLFKTIGVMLPNDPLVETGHELVVNCTLLPNYDGPYNSSHITFKFGNMTIDKSYVKIKDNATAQLNYTNVTRAISGKHFFCYLPETTHAIGQQRITVADRPTKPVLKECRVHNWVNMTCTWEPQVQDTGLDTTQHLFWTLMTVCKKWYVCPSDNTTREKPGQCSWLIDDGNGSLRVDKRYCMLVNATNLIGTSHTGIIHIETAEQVEPNPVGNLRVRNKTSTRLALKWDSPKEDKDILYKVLYRSERETEWKSLETNSTSADLTGLAPYTWYTINVTCKPLINGQPLGFWSRPVILSNRTQEDVPAANPVMAAGSYQSTDHSDMLRTITVFWQPIPVVLKNGIISYHHLQYFSGSRPEDMQTKDAIGESFSAEVTLYKNENYTFLLNSRTSVGFNNSLQPSRLFIPSDSHSPPKSGDFIAIAKSDQEVMMNWTEVENATGYTLFWCRGSHTTLKCQTGFPLEWLAFEPNVTSYSMEVPDLYTSYIFAVSVEQSLQQGTKVVKRSVPQQVVSSGLLWSECTYDIKKKKVPTATLR